MPSVFRPQCSYPLRIIVCILCLSALLTLFAASSSPAATRSIKRVVRAHTVEGDTREIELYSGYLALVIGCAAYNNGWAPLPNPVKDARKVTAALKKIGFTVTLIENPDASALSRALNGLVGEVGDDVHRAVLVYFAGHGHTLKQMDGQKLGYIVPVDAPDPDKDMVGFIDRAMSMRDIEEISKLIRARHVLMAFDSCFSGSVFRAPPDRPSKYIREQIARPVRAYITAGDENEKVSDDSVFKTCFIQGLTDRYADLNKDGYVTGQELGLYLREEVVNYTNGAQHPKYGTIRNPQLDKGDFVFLASSTLVETPQAPKSETGSLRVDSSPPNAEIWVNGQSRGRAPLVLENLKPGARLNVQAALKGYENAQKRVRIRAGVEAHVTLYLDALKTFGSLEVKSEPSGAEWFLDGDYIGVTPDQMKNVKPGRHQIRVSKKGYADWRQTVSVDSDKRTPVFARLEPQAGSGQAKITNSIGMEFVYIPPGEFMMGSPADEPKRNDDEKQHKVILTQGFYLQTTEVTQGQWRVVMGSDPPDLYFKNCGDDCPVERVSWNDVQEYIQKLNQKERTNKYQLPTEAQWEYACRAGTTTPFAFGDCLSTDQANYDGNYPVSGCSKGKYRKKTIPVAGFKPNRWGLYDMHGNVWEWCQDRYGDYPSEAVTDPQGSETGSARVVRGGGWYIGAGYCRSALRYGDGPGSRGSGLGFRLLRTP